MGAPLQMLETLKRTFRSITAFMAQFGGPEEPRTQIIEALDDTLVHANGRDYVACAITLNLDHFSALSTCHEGHVLSAILQVITHRLKGGLLARDVVRRLDGGQFAIALSPLRTITPDSVAELTKEIQNLIQDPISINGNQAHLTAAIGYAMSPQFDDPSGIAILEAARISSIEAANAGSAMTCGYAPQMGENFHRRKMMAREIRKALDNGDITAFFQPQICLTTQEISGFEALARWVHVSHGMIPPVDFIPILEQAGLMRELGLAMLRHALTALKSWDAAGLNVPCVSVNMSLGELRNPNLVSSIQMELDAFDLAPHRLVIEVLETVVASDNDDLIVKNLEGLSKLGCSIDLDDFGTGHAAITTIKQFAVNRIKIDRSFVSGIDVDDDRQQMVSAIMMIAEKLAVETLAEGAETKGEIAHLASSGCGHVQGFGIAKPLPPAETTDWIKSWIVPPQTENTKRLA